MNKELLKKIKESGAIPKKADDWGCEDEESFNSALSQINYEKIVEVCRNYYKEEVKRMIKTKSSYMFPATEERFLSDLEELNKKQDD